MSKLSEIVHTTFRSLGISGLPVWLSQFTDKAIPFIPLNRHFGPDDQVSVVRDGVRFDVNRSDYMQWHLWSNLVEDNWKHCAKNYREGSVIIDVGANTGAFSLKIANHLNNRMGRTGRVIAVEPNPQIAKLLRHQLNGNPDIAKSIEVWEMALGNYEGSIYFQVDQSNTGGGKVSNERSDTTITVPVHRLDDLISKRHVTNVGILKIDVEGFEWEVLDGAMNLIEKDLPILYLEVTDSWLRSRGHSAYEMLYALKDRFGYHFLRDLGSDLQPLELSQDGFRVIFEKEHQINVIGLPKENVIRREL